MKVLGLGHSCFLVEMARANAEGVVRILADPWITDYVIGDVMGRYPRIRIDYAALGAVDGIFLSHSHTDHFCPYSLLQLWGELPKKPAILLPQSLLYLEEVLRENLADVEIVHLQEDSPVEFEGVRVSALFNLEQRATNEDDVMVLVLENGREVFFSESDAVLPFYDPHAREQISGILGDTDLETVCFVTTKNELEATMAMVDAKDLEDRHERLGSSLERTYDEIGDLYAPTDDEEGDLWQNPKLVRLIGGQGIAFPQEVNPNWNKVLFPIRLRDRARMEQEVAQEHGFQHTIAELQPGFWHEVSGGELAEPTRAPELSLLDREEDREFDAELELFEEFPTAPLFDQHREVDAERVLRCLNERFLPFLIGSRVPPVEHLLSAHGGEYRIRVRYGTTAEHVDRDYAIGFARLRFEERAVEGEPQEFYWGNDIDDYLEGRADDFSTFPRHPLGGSSTRFWSCLGMPYLNNDLVERKFRHHFERAREGRTASEWVLPFYGEQS